MNTLVVTDKDEILTAAGRGVLYPLHNVEQRAEKLIAVPLGQPKIREQLGCTILDIKLLYDCISNIEFALLGQHDMEGNLFTSTELPPALSIGESATFLLAYTTELLAKAKAITACL